MKRILLALLLPWTSSAAAFDLAGRDLLDQDFSYAARVSGRAGVVVFGFTKGSSEQSKAWHRGLVEALKGDSSVAVVSVALLEKAPGFVRGFIKKGMRKDAPAELHPWMVVLDKDTLAWEKALGYDPKASPDHARIVTVDAHGSTLAVTFDAYGPTALARVLGQLLPKGKR